MADERADLTPIVNYLRQWGNAATTDSFNGVTYWTGEQLEQIADAWAERLTVRLRPVTQDGLTYVIMLPKNRRPDPGTMIVYNSAGTEVSTSYTFNADRNELVFSTELAEDYYYLEALYINLWLALADLWEQKAAQRANYVDFKAGATSIKLQQEFEHCAGRAKYYRNKVVRRHQRGWRG